MLLMVTILLRITYPALVLLASVKLTEVSSLFPSNYLIGGAGDGLKSKPRLWVGLGPDCEHKQLSGYFYPAGEQPPRKTNTSHTHSPPFTPCWLGNALQAGLGAVPSPPFLSLSPPLQTLTFLG